MINFPSEKLEKKMIYRTFWNISKFYQISHKLWKQQNFKFSYTQ